MRGLPLHVIGTLPEAVGRLDEVAVEFTSFSHAARESTDSRVYAGIHFRTACEDGLVLGRKIGQRAVALTSSLPGSDGRAARRRAVRRSPAGGARCARQPGWP